MCVLVCAGEGGKEVVDDAEAHTPGDQSKLWMGMHTFQAQQRQWRMGVKACRCARQSCLSLMKLRATRSLHAL
eukprot:scaffold20417_cov21-Tisochrysis_lutea.AAC.2